MSASPILFVWGRPKIPSGRLYTMPFGMNVLYYLLEDGYEVDICLLEHPSYEYLDLLPSQPRIRFMGGLLNIDHARVKYWRTTLSFFPRVLHRHIIAVGQMGAVAANAVWGPSKNIAYLNDEFPSIYGDKLLMRKEVELIGRASVIALPDMCRLRYLERDIGMNISRDRAVEISNAPGWITPDDVPSIDWRERLNLGRHKKIVLCSGGMWNALQLRETLTTARLWSDEFVLVMNSHSIGMLLAYKQMVKHLHDDNKIVWLQEALTEDEFNSLVASSFCHVCLYSSENDNEFWVGKASGKAMRSLLLGVPVLCSAYPSFDFVRENKLGVCIEHPLDIAPALGVLNEHHADYAARCRQYAKTEINPRRDYDHFRRKFLGDAVPRRRLSRRQTDPRPPVLYQWEFHAPEPAADGSVYRWMGRTGHVRLRNLAHDMTLGLRLAVPLSQLRGAPDVHIELNHQLVEAVHGAPGLIEVTRDIPAARQGRGEWSELRIRTTEAFVPREVNPLSADERHLGLCLERLTWQPKRSD